MIVPIHIVLLTFWLNSYIHYLTAAPQQHYLLSTIILVVTHVSDEETAAQGDKGFFQK